MPLRPRPLRSLLALCALLLAVYSVPQASAQPLRVLTTEEAPTNYTRDGLLTGITVDIVRTLLERQGLKTPIELRDYAGLDEVAERLRKTNPLLQPARAAWLAQHWSRRNAQGRYEILADPVHKRGTPMLYQRDEVLESWKRINAPVMWVEGDQTDVARWWGNRYPLAEFHARLDVVTSRVERHTLAPAGHMLHHDQPEALARLLEGFLGDGPVA